MASPGQSWADPYSPLTISVGAARPDGIPVNISYDDPCATIHAPTEVFGPDEISTTITVAATPNCVWSATTTDAWLSLSGPIGSGNGIVPVTIATNRGEERTGHIAVGRQVVAIVQSGKEPASTVAVEPRFGSGMTQTFTITLTNSDATVDVSSPIDIAFFGSDPCHLEVSPATKSVRLWREADSIAASLNLDGSENRVSSNVCTISAKGSTITITPHKITIQLPITFSAQFAGIHRIRINQSRIVGTWSVPFPPATSIEQIRNAASQQSGPIAPGELILIEGTGLGPDAQLTNGSLRGEKVGEVAIDFDGVPARLASAKGEQLVAIVPDTIAGQTTSALRITYQDRTSPPLTLSVAQAAPGIFTSNGQPTGQAAARNQDGSTNTPKNPAGKGSTITVYATGLGHQTTPGAGGDQTTPVVARIAGRTAEVIRASAILPGIWAITLRIPADATRGDAIPIDLAMAAAKSQDNITIAIK